MENQFWVSIYMIKSNNPEHPERYVGSTKCELYVRYANHKVDYRRFIEGIDTRQCQSFILFDKYGVENCSCILITQCLCSSKEERNKLEKYWINQIPNTINLINPYRTLEQKKIYHHEWRHAQGTTECPCGGQYITTRQKEHEQTVRHKAWVNGNPIVPKGIACPCGGNYTPQNKKTHEKCKRHLEYLESTK